MRLLQPLFEKNLQWAARMRERDPQFFERLTAQQNPQYLWIGCSDSRVPANEIVDLLPGEVFVHRNVANVVHQSDMNCLSVLQYAVEVLDVRHVIVVGHYGCGGVRQALEEGGLGMIDHWLAPVRRIRRRNQEALDQLPSMKARWDRLCELNVMEQAIAVSQTTIIRGSWAQGREIAVHGWIYDLHDGRLRDLEVTVDFGGRGGRIATAGGGGGGLVAIEVRFGGRAPGNFPRLRGSGAGARKNCCRGRAGAGRTSSCRWVGACRHRWLDAAAQGVGFVPEAGASGVAQERLPPLAVGLGAGPAF